jgi:hypothetical protein
LLFPVHCDRPFVGPVYEVILALVRNVRNGVIRVVLTVDPLLPLLPSKPRKVSRMRLAPVAQRAITFTLVISKRLIDFIKTSLRQFNRLEDGFRSPLPI